MRKIGNIFGLIFSVLIFNYCSQNKYDTIAESANYDPQTHILKVDHSINQDTILLQIVAFSEIRRSGYGLLMNIENSFSSADIDTLKLKFKKLDINAVHSFNVSLIDPLEVKVKIAMEGAQFIWLLDHKNSTWKSAPLGKTISAIQDRTEDRVLIVVDNN